MRQWGQPDSGREHGVTAVCPLLDVSTGRDDCGAVAPMTEQ